MRHCSRSLVSVVVLLVLAVAFAAVLDPVLCKTAASAGVPTFEVTPLPELSGGSRIVGDPGSFIARIVLSGQTRETGGQWKACVWLRINEPWGLSTLPSLDATRPSVANIAGLALSGFDTVCVAAGYSYNAQNQMKPIVWRKTVVDTSTWTSTTLPTLEGLEGAVLSVIDGEGSGILGEEGDDLVGWSSATGPVEKAVLWTYEDGTGTWVVRMLSHYADGLPGHAHDGFVSAAEETTICGWAQDSSGDTTAVVWQRSTGPWTRTALPLLSGGTQGMANSILGEEVDDLVGWSENATGERRAVRWYNAGGWQVEELGQLAGYSQSAGLTGEVWQDIYADPYFLVVGRSWDPEASCATIWGLEEGNYFTRDLNEIVVDGGAPTLTEAAGIIILDPVNEIMIAANGVEPVLGGYSVLQTSDPHAYVLTSLSAETAEAVPALGSYGSVAVLVVLLLGVATRELLRRRLSAARTRA